MRTLPGVNVSAPIVGYPCGYQQCTPPPHPSRPPQSASPSISPSPGASAPVTPPARPEVPQLPETGSDPLTTMLVGLALLAAGIGAVWLAARHFRA